MSKRPSLADVTALKEAAGSRRPSLKSAPAIPVSNETQSGYSGRAGTKPITVHYPPDVRRQIKALAIERDTTVQDLIAEAFNDLFVKYGKPEIAPRSANK